MASKVKFLLASFKPASRLLALAIKFQIDRNLIYLSYFLCIMPCIGHIICFFNAPNKQG